MMNKKPMFDFVIGNPPYQENREKAADKPIYHEFMQAVYPIANETMLITPARFLFNAGGTPKCWNKKMLSSPHFRVLKYIAEAQEAFPQTDIKGGVAIHQYSQNKLSQPIEVFYPFNELRSILQKTTQHPQFAPIKDIMYSHSAYTFTKIAEQELSQYKEIFDNKITFGTNCFSIFSTGVFFDKIPGPLNRYVQMYGRDTTGRICKYIKASYVNDPGNLNYWKVFLPNSNGCGALGEPLSTPVIGQPVIGHTETFISIGTFTSEAEATACLSYIKTKFARCMLGILKATQHNGPEKWIYVPLQDFTAHSDIEWSQSVANIDKQLYTKYGLSQAEIDFIESHVKEME